MKTCRQPAYNKFVSERSSYSEFVFQFVGSKISPFESRFAIVHTVVKQICTQSHSVKIGHDSVCCYVEGANGVGFIVFVVKLSNAAG